jgi:lysophospholipase L1-like esterase
MSCAQQHATAARLVRVPVWQTAAVQAMSTVRTTPARDETCRQVLRTTAGGGRIRLRLSNVMSSMPLSLNAVTVGLRGAGAALVGPPQPVTIGGASTVIIPPGKHVTTDSVALRITTGADVAVSFAVAGTAILSEHLVGAATGWCTQPGAGDHTTDTAPTAFANASRESLVLEAVEVEVTAPRSKGVLAVGDSLTDPPLPPDTYQRWTDVVAATGVPVANVAIGGNRVMLPGGYGRTLTERFADDLLDRPGAGTLILFAGTNDVSAGITADALTTRLEELIREAKAHSLRVVVVTFAPAWKRPAANEQVRQQVNTWLRTTPYADLRVDADKLLRDPARPTHLRRDYDFGDGLHLSAAGHRALGKAIVRVLAG